MGGSQLPYTANPPHAFLGLWGACPGARLKARQLRTPVGAQESRPPTTFRSPWYFEGVIIPNYIHPHPSAGYQTAVSILGVPHNRYNSDPINLAVQRDSVTWHVKGEFRPGKLCLDRWSAENPPPHTDWSRKLAALPAPVAPVAEDADPFFSTSLGSKARKLIGKRDAHRNGLAEAESAIAQIRDSRPEIAHLL